MLGWVFLKMLGLFGWGCWVEVVKNFKVVIPGLGLFWLLGVSFKVVELFPSIPLLCFVGIMFFTIFDYEVLWWLLEVVGIKSWGKIKIEK